VKSCEEAGVEAKEDDDDSLMGPSHSTKRLNDSIDTTSRPSPNGSFSAVNVVSWCPASPHKDEQEQQGMGRGESGYPGGP
jgi:hypothetical protein